MSFPLYLASFRSLVENQGSGYTRKEIRAVVESFKVSIEEAPIEAPGTFGVAEKYHALHVWYINNFLMTPIA